MIKTAFATRVQNLDHELRGLRMNCDEQKGQAATLQRKNSALEAELVESQQKAQGLTEENRELFKNVQTLRKQLMKLEGIKKKVCDVMSDDPSNDYEPTYAAVESGAP